MGGAGGMTGRGERREGSTPRPAHCQAWDPACLPPPSCICTGYPPHPLRAWATAIPLPHLRLFLLNHKCNPPPSPSLALLPLLLPPPSPHRGGVNSSHVVAQEAGYLYRYRYNGLGSGAAFVGQYNFVLIDIAAGPVSYGPLASPSGAVAPTGMPRLMVRGGGGGKGERGKGENWGRGVAAG